MKPIFLFCAGFAASLALAGLAAGVAASREPSTGAAAQTEDGTPRYDPAGRLIPPAGYRDWVFLSSSLDMSYTENPAMAGMHMFDNVFAPRAAYESFKRTGVWPDKTVLVMETRGATSKGSINRQGQFQNGDVMGWEAHVKDTARFKGGWGFFAFDGTAPAPSAQIPYAAACYACHQAHAAADTTFVQFYPTLLPVARKLGTLSAGYLADNGGAAI
jgi:Cytochrome P460